MRTAVLKQQSDDAGAVAALAVDLQLPIIEMTSADLPCAAEEFDYLLGFHDSRLTLCSANPDLPGELSVDFSDAKLKYRAQSAIKKQNIAKAIGVKGNNRPSVLDATAGLGKDAYLLASLGCEVTLVERSPLVHALLEDGIGRRGFYDSETAKTLSRMSLRQGDFLQLELGTCQYDTVYLDPMFPDRRKRAKVKKDMAFLQQLLGSQSDGADLLEHARQFASKRIVVKRAKLSPQLGRVKPDIQFRGSSSRYDVYLVAR